MDQEERNAIARITAAVKGAPLVETSGDSAHMLQDPKVTLGVEIGGGVFSSASLQNPSERLIVTFDDPSIAHLPQYAAQTICKQLAQIPELAQYVQFENKKEHALKLKAQLQNFIASGADLPPNFLEWGGFDPEIATKTWSIGKHGVNVNRADLQTVINMPIPAADVPDVNSKEIVGRVEQNINARMPEIRELLTQRIGILQGAVDKKTKQVTNETALAEIRRKVEELQINVHAEPKSELGGYSRDSNITITLRSPDQLSQGIDGTKFAALPEAEQKAVANSNILSSLPDEQLGRVLGRAFLHTGPAADEIFPLVAGRKDMQTAIAKSLRRLKATKPELATEIDAFMHDDAFKDHNEWALPESKKEPLKPQPVFSKETGKPLKMEIDLDAGVAAKIIAELSNAHIAAGGGQEMPAQSLGAASGGPIKLACFDLDCTLLNGRINHSLREAGIPSGSATPEILEEHLEKVGGIKNRMALQKTMKDLLQSGVKVAITSFSDHPESIPFVLRKIGLNESEIAQIHNASSRPEIIQSEMGYSTKDGKNDHIQRAIESFGGGIAPSEVVLVDDNMNNYELAKQKGYQVIWVQGSEGDVGYLNDLREMAGLSTPQQFAQQQPPAASPSLFENPERWIAGLLQSMGLQSRSQGAALG